MSVNVSLRSEKRISVYCPGLLPGVSARPQKQPLSPSQWGKKLCSYLLFHKSFDQMSTPWTL